MEAQIDFLSFKTKAVLVGIAGPDMAGPLLGETSFKRTTVLPKSAHLFGFL